MLHRLDLPVSYLRRHHVALAALFFALGGTAYAAIRAPDSQGVIHACFNTKTGALRVLTARTRCRTRERALSWNQQGISGAAGPPGASGHAGANGGAGEPGAPGPFPGVLPAGITVRGNWAGGSSTTGTSYGSISFGFTFASPPAFHYVAGPVSVPAGCAGGTSSNPTAQPGNLCVYSNGFPLNTTGAVVTGGPDDWGTLFTVSSEKTGAFNDGGSWAATSP